MLSQGPVLEPPNTLSPFRTRPASLIGARRMFPAHFKLQVLDAYRFDNECKGNQRATARKFNVHRRQIQKWLQCESALRASVADALQYSAEASKLSNFNKNCANGARLPEPSSRVFKHDARTLKLVAQKLYPSTMSGPISKDDQKGDVKSCFVPKEHQLNDTVYREMGVRPSHVDNLGCKFNIRVHHSVPSLNLKDNVTFQTESKLPKNISPRPQELRILPAPKPLTHPPIAHGPIYSSASSSTSSVSPYSDEPYNLVKNAPTSPPTAPRPVTPKAELPVGANTSSTSPLPARVAEIVADSKTSAFSPKRKWLNDCLQDKNNENNPPAVRDEPKQKKPCLNFSIERLCGISEKESALPLVPACYPAPLSFPPPLVLQNRSIPELATLHFKPEFSEQIIVKEEAISDDEEPIDVISTTPLEEKSFEFPECSGGKRRSFPIQFKINVLDAFYNDKDCNQNQRATARKFNINRRQVQKWLNLEESLRGAVCQKCPQHCAINFQHCSEPSCLQDLSSGFYTNSSQSSAFPLPLMPWYFPYGMNGIY